MYDDITSQAWLKLVSVIFSSEILARTMPCFLQAAEELVVWDYENLLTEVASELNTDKEGLLAGSIAHAEQ